VSLDDIARQAGVGIGTLYRHFPTREALLAAASDERLFALAQTSRGRDASMGAGAAFRAYLTDLIRNTAMYSGLAASLGIVLRNGSPGCHAALEEGLRLLARAQRARDLRSDVSIEDVVCIATAIALAAAEDARPNTHIERLVTMFVDGIAQR
jgi:AcrR family transcriptional regulator